MENNSLKTIGKVYSFDGEAGIIITKDGEYLFNINNVKGLTNLQKNDTVSFYPSTFKFGKEIFKVAREVEELTNRDVKALKKN